MHFSPILQAYGDWSDIEYLQENEECLLMKTNQTNTTRYKEIEATLSINKLTAPNYAARSNDTNIEASIEYSVDKTSIDAKLKLLSFFIFMFNRQFLETAINSPD